MFCKEKRLFAVLLIILGSGMVSSCKPPVDPAKEAADRAAAEAEVHQVMSERKRREVAEAQAAAESQAAAERQAAEQEAQRQEEASRPRFSPEELAEAATPKVWAAISVPDNINIKAVLNSTWTNGNLNYRVALLGTSQGLEAFMRFGRYRINFAEQGGSSIFDFELAPRDFVWAPPKTNGGIPTMESRGSVPMDLSLYQATRQWNLTWYQ